MKQRNCWPDKVPSNRQMELGLGNEQQHRNRSSCLPAAGLRRHRRVSRARWWFSHMREIVEHAVDRQPAPPPPPVQNLPPIADSNIGERN